MDYNTERPKLLVPEYGRNIQKMVDYACTVKDQAERTNIANAIIQMMIQLHPKRNEVVDLKHKLWDHLHIIADHKLDVDGPFPKPDPKGAEKIEKLQYPDRKIRYKHYGKTVEHLITAAVAMKDGEEKDTLVGLLANLMKRNYLAWNRNSVEDELIVQHISELSDGKLKLPEGFQMEETRLILASIGTTTSRPTNKKRRNKSNRQNRNRRRRH